MKKKIHYIGLSSDLGGNIEGSAKGPLKIAKALDFAAFDNIEAPKDKKNDYTLIAALNEKLAEKTYTASQQKEFFVVLGGDHSCAIGTWSGASCGYDGKIGLVWIDAHMDAHTNETSPSGNIHGMPIASLLGKGDARLAEILSKEPKIKPENLSLIGIRSFEDPEVELLKKLDVQIFYMEDVEKLGFGVCLKRAIEHVSKNTIGFGISFDLDSLDPKFANAVGTPVEDGLNLNEVTKAFETTRLDKLIGFELVEYNPDKDPDLLSLDSIEKIFRSLKE